MITRVNYVKRNYFGEEPSAPAEGWPHRVSDPACLKAAVGVETWRHNYTSRGWVGGDKITVRGCCGQKPAAFQFREAGRCRRCACCRVHVLIVPYEAPREWPESWSPWGLAGLRLHLRIILTCFFYDRQHSPSLLCYSVKKKRALRPSVPFF